MEPDRLNFARISFPAAARGPHRTWPFYCVDFDFLRSTVYGMEEDLWLISYHWKIAARPPDGSIR